jgi:DNA replication protein DnaC
MSRETLEISLKRLREMRLPMMAEQILMMTESNEISTISAVEMLDRISGTELVSRKNNTIDRLKRSAKLSQRYASIQEIDYRAERKINKSIIDQLMTNDYIIKHRNVILLGACGTGKSFIANALGNHSCEGLFHTFYCRLFEFLDECNHSQILTGSIDDVLRRYLKFDLLILDDFLISELTSRETAYLFRLVEYRHGNKSTIVCSQMEPSEWHGHLGGGIMADSILDRIIPSAYQLVIRGDSMRTI